MALCRRKTSTARLKEEIESRVKSISESLHICDILSKFPYEVSGGQKQRAAVFEMIGLTHPNPPIRRDIGDIAPLKFISC